MNTGYPSIDKPWMKYYEGRKCFFGNPEQTLFDFAYEANKEFLDTTAIEYLGRKITYRSFFNTIEKCKDNLAALGIGKGDIITVQSLAVPQAYILLYAASLLGACINFLFITSPEKEVLSSIQETNSKLFVSLDMAYSKYTTDFSKTVPTMIISITDEMAGLKKYAAKLMMHHKIKGDNILRWNQFMSQKHPKVESLRGGELPVAMTYTGGTTGKSKAVMLSSQNLNCFPYQLINGGMDYERGKKLLNTLPPFIAYGLTVGFHLPICAGHYLVLEPDSTLDNTAELYLKHKPHYYSSGVVQADKILTEALKRNESLTFIDQLVTGGDAMPVSKQMEYNDILNRLGCNHPVMCGYGMSEISALISTENPHAQKTGTVGIPTLLSNVRIENTDTGVELSYNQVGEICVSSKCIMLGYYHNEEATNEIIKHDEDGTVWLHTGDLGKIDEDGFLTIVGRIKRMILCREGAIFHKVFPKVIEEEIEKDENVELCTVVGVPDDTNVHKLAAYIVKKKATANVDVVESTQARLSKSLESFEQPAYYFCVDQLPRTSIGKVDFIALEKDAVQRINAVG